MKNTGLARVALGIFAGWLLLCCAGCAEQGEHTLYQRITVTGQGTASIAPDMAVLTLTVSRQADTARKALDANSAAMEKVMDAMAALDIAGRDLQTSNFAIEPRYSYPSRQAKEGDRTPRLIGYTVRNTLTVRVRDIERVGEVLDKSVTLGVNEGGTILFSNEDASGVRKKARVEAVADAMAKAETLAKGAGVEPGQVLEISEHASNPRPMPMARASFAADSGAEAVPIAGGENAYSVTVNLVLAIDQ